MSLTRKLVLLALAAAAVTAMVAPPASAQEPLLHNQTPKLRVTDAISGALCPAVSPTPAPNPAPGVTSGGCRVHVSGPNIMLFQHIFGAESVNSSCNLEFVARLDSQGEGYLTHVELTQGTTGTCVRRPCAFGAVGSPEGKAWGVYGRETGPGAEQITALLCVENNPAGDGDIHCEVDIPFSAVSTHHYRFQSVSQALGGSPGHGPDGFRCELVGALDTEEIVEPTGENQTEQRVAIHHVP